MDHKSNYKKCVNSYHVMLFSYKKEWSTDTIYNLGETWKHYAKWKKPVTKDHILYDFIYRKCSE